MEMIMMMTSGIITRKCTEAGSWDEADDSDCLNEMLLEFQDEVKIINY